MSLMGRHPLIAPLALSLMLAVTVASGAPRSVAFVDVTLVSMAQEGAVEHQTVLVSGERISAVGRAGEVQIPAGSVRIGGAGRFLMPGLIDMHVHFARRPEAADPAEWRFPDYQERNRDFGVLFVANGVTTVRQLHGHPAGDALATESTTSKWLGPAIYSTGPITDGDPPTWPIARIVRTPAEAEAAVLADKTAGYIGVKVYDNLSVSLYDAIVAAAARNHIDVVGHIPDAVGASHAIAAHQHTIEHTDSFITSLQPGAEVYEAPSAGVTWAQLVERVDIGKLAVLADEIRRAGIWVTPTVVVTQLESSGEDWAAEMQYLPKSYIDKLTARYAGLMPPFEPDRALALSITRELHRHGVGLLLGSDTLKRNVMPGFSALHELAYLRQAGLTPFEALQCGTINAARALHQEALLGTVEPGKRADLILLEANPLMDVQNVSRRTGVMLRGQWLTEERLQGRLRRIAGPIARSRGVGRCVTGLCKSGTVGYR